MRSVLLSVFCLAQLACVGGEAVYSVQTDGSQTPPPMQKPPPLAVWGTTSSVVGAATTWLQKRGLSVIERTRLQNILTEQKVRLTATTDHEGDLLSIGKLAGASVLVFADGNAIPGNASVSVRAVDVETAVVLWSGSAQYTGPLVYVDYALAGLTCEALATAWAFRSPGRHEVKESEHCQTPTTGR
jgi:hypothetical protein